MNAINRRGLLLAAAAAAPLAVVLKDARLAKAAADSLEEVTLTTAGGQTVIGALGLPEAQNAPAVILIHEWWGLNDQIKAVAADLAKQGYLALAVDLFKGSVASTPEEAKAQTSGVVGTEAIDTMTSWVEWLSGHQRGNGKVATLG